MVLRDLDVYQGFKLFMRGSKAHGALKKRAPLKLALDSVLVGSFRNSTDPLFGECCCPIASHDMAVQYTTCFFFLRAATHCFFVVAFGSSTQAF